MVHRSLHSDELKEDLRRDLKTRVGRDESGELFLLILVHELNGIVVGGEGTENVYKRISGDNGLVRLVVRALVVV